MTQPPEQPVPPLSSDEKSAVERVSASPPVEGVKMARILEEEDGVFSLEYDNTRGEKNTMSLDAVTYPRGLREARSFLGIDEDNRDEDGTLWDIE